VTDQQVIEVGLLERLDDLRDVVADHAGQDAGEEVEVAVSLGVDHVPAISVDEGDRLVVVQGEPVRHDRPVPGEQFGVGHGEDRAPVGVSEWRARERRGAGDPTSLWLAGSGHQPTFCR